MEQRRGNQVLIRAPKNWDLATIEHTTCLESTTAHSF